MSEVEVAADDDFMTSADDDDFMTPAELAAYLRIARKTVYASIQEGTIPGVKRFGRHIRIYRPAVLEWAVKREERKRR